MSKKGYRGTEAQRKIHSVQVSSRTYGDICSGGMLVMNTRIFSVIGEPNWGKGLLRELEEMPGSLCVSVPLWRLCLRLCRALVNGAKVLWGRRDDSFLTGAES